MLGRLLSRADPVLRMKAVLLIAGEHRPAVLHAVGHRAERMTYLPRWPSGTRTGAVTLIGDYSQSPTLEELADRLLEQQPQVRSEEHTSELQSLMRISYAVF